MPALTGRQRLAISEESLLRLSAVVDLASALGSSEYESPSNSLEDFLDNLFAGERRSSDASVDPLFDVADKIAGEDKDYDELAHRLARANLLGFAVEFQTPVRREATESGCEFSWGRCYVKWFYAETIDDAWRLAEKWAEAERKAAIEKTRKENAA